MARICSRVVMCVIGVVFLATTAAAGMVHVQGAKAAVSLAGSREADYGGSLATTAQSANRSGASVPERVESAGFLVVGGSGQKTTQDDDPALVFGQQAGNASAPQRIEEAGFLVVGGNESTPMGRNHSRAPRAAPGTRAPRLQSTEHSSTPSGGLVDSATGEYLPPVKNGWISTRNGTFYLRSQEGGGVINTRTGHYIPILGEKPAGRSSPH